MGLSRKWKRKTRRQWKAALNHPHSKPMHKSPKGRTGTAHTKARGGISRKRWVKLAALVLGPDWALRPR